MKIASRCGSVEKYFHFLNKNWFSFFFFCRFCRYLRIEFEAFGMSKRPCACSFHNSSSLLLWIFRTVFVSVLHVMYALVCVVIFVFVAKIAYLCTFLRCHMATLTRCIPQCVGAYNNLLRHEENAPTFTLTPTSIIDIEGRRSVFFMTKLFYF